MVVCFRAGDETGTLDLKERGKSEVLKMALVLY